MKNPGSTPDKKVEWSVLILFLLSDPAHSHIGWQCPEHLELVRGVRASVHWGLLFSGIYPSLIN